MLVKKLKVLIEGTEYFVDVKKVFSYSSDIDYYEYYVSIYSFNKNKWFKKYKLLWKWNTYWLEYLKYAGDIDRTIKEAISHYERNLREQKYITKKEVEYKRQSNTTQLY